MVSVEKAVIAKLKKEGQIFEILVDCESALKLKHGENVEMQDVLAVDKIFKDARKGDLAAEVEKHFKTSDVNKIAEEIIKKGEVQLTADYRKKLIESKKSEVVGVIVRNAMDPVKKLPIPRTRIELAMDQIGVHIDPFRTAEDQMESVVERLRPVLPISFEEKKFEVLIPARHAGSCYGILKKYGKLTDEEWLSTGSLKAEIEMPAGMAEEFTDALNKKTGGDVQITEK